MSLKDSYMSLAEQIARDDYRTDFYKLSDDIQAKVYNEAMETVIDNVVGDY